MNKNSNRSLKIIFIAFLIISPSIIYAHGGEAAIIFLASIIYFLLFGLILGLIEYKLFGALSGLDIKYGRLILFNYIILILTYFIFVFLAYISTNIYKVPVDSIYDPIEYQQYQHVANVKLLVSILIYLIAIIGLKYMIYRKKIFLNDKKGNKLLLILIPNVIFFGLFFGIIFNILVWFFS